VTLHGGRVLLGDLQCLDKQGNLILGNTVEELAHVQGDSSERAMGMVLVPQSQQRSIQLLVSCCRLAAGVWGVCACGSCRPWASAGLGPLGRAAAGGCACAWGRAARRHTHLPQAAGQQQHPLPCCCAGHVVREGKDDVAAGLLTDSSSSLAATGSVAARRPAPRGGLVAQQLGSQAPHRFFPTGALPLIALIQSNVMKSFV